MDKPALYRRYLNDVFIRGWIAAIHNDITSGGYAIEEVERGGSNLFHREQVEQLLTQVGNEIDFLRLVRAIITDLLIFGEAYLEIVLKSGQPFSLHRLDCISMSYKLNKHNKVVGYQQALPSSLDTVDFQPEEVVRWWFPDPDDHIQALSPLEHLTSAEIGASQSKGFRFHTCDPVKYLFFEKFNYRVLVKGLGITDWRVTTRYAAG